MENLLAMISVAVQARRAAVDDFCCFSGGWRRCPLRPAVPGVTVVMHTIRTRFTVIEIQ
jgi:hypothetical protein